LHFSSFSYSDVEAKKGLYEWDIAKSYRAFHYYAKEKRSVKKELILLEILHCKVFEM